MLRRIEASRKAPSGNGANPTPDGPLGLHAEGIDPQAAREDWATTRRVNGNGNGNGGGHHSGNGDRLAAMAAASAVDPSTMRHGDVAVEPLASRGGASGLHLSSDDYRLVCPECGFGLQIAEGCKKCLACGWAQC